jgi:hypothetical protein
VRAGCDATESCEKASPSKAGLGDTAMPCAFWAQAAHWTLLGPKSLQRNRMAERRGCTVRARKSGLHGGELPALDRRQRSTAAQCLSG